MSLLNALVAVWVVGFQAPPSEPLITLPTGPAPSTVPVRMLTLPGAGTEAPGGLIRVNDAAMPVPKRAPRGGEFPWLVASYGQRPDRAQMDLRFRVYAMTQGPDAQPATSMARMLIRLWKLNVDKLRLDHSEAFGNRVVDVYLRTDGKAGGEQRFDADVVNGRSVNVNTITIFDIGSFTDPLEMAREVAHEYGHASLPPVGGYTAPEDWANGLLGERLFLKWLREEVRAGRLTPDDTMGATLAQLSRYVDQRVTPAIRRIRERGPDPVALARRDEAGMEAYVAHVLASEELLPPGQFLRSMLLNTENQADAVPAAVVAAAAEVPRWTLAVPAGQRVWIPLGQGQLTGGRVLARRLGWAQVQVQSSPLVVVNPRPSE